MSATAESVPAADEPLIDILDVVGRGFDDVEVVLVTGSRLGRSSTDSYGNVVIITQDDISRTGAANIAEVLRLVPNISNQGLSLNANNGGNGRTFIDLRNLGTLRSLILINGRRMVATAGIGENNGVDFSTIPITMVDRIEVLLDGASAIYGSDAIAGVINVVMKDRFEGFELRALGGISDNGDAEQTGFFGTTGTNFDKGSLVMSFGYVRDGQIRQRNRNWAANPTTDGVFDPSTGQTGNVYGSAFGPRALDPATGAYFDPVIGADGSLISSYRDFGTGPNGDRYNYGNDQWLRGKLERFNIAANGRYELSSTIEAYSEAIFSQRQSNQRLAPQPLGNASGTYPDGFLIPGTNPYIPGDYRANGGGADANGNYTVFRRLFEVGNRNYSQTATVFRLVGGVRGDVLDGNLSWDFNLNYGQSRATNTSNNQINFTRALQTADPALCAQNAALGCVVGNWYAPRLDPALARYIRYRGTEDNGYNLFMAEGLVRAKLMDLPGGKLRIAVGGDYRRESGFASPDSVNASGESYSNASTPVSGNFHVYEGFAEMNAPLLANIPGAHELSVDLAGRYSDYSTSGSQFTWRGGVAYAPITDIKLRANWSTSFRAPSVSELFSGTQDSFIEVNDPCDPGTVGTNPNFAARCAAAGIPGTYQQSTYGAQVRTNVGGNPNLRSETAKNLNAGVVLQPRFIKDLTLTFDYWWYKVDGGIGTLDPQVVLNRCYGDAAAGNPACALITRGTQGNIVNVIGTNQNLSSIETDGIDLSAQYNLPLSRLGAPRAGTVNLAWRGTYLHKFDQVDEGSDNVVHYAGTVTDTSGAYFKWKWNVIVRYTLDNLALQGRVRYLGGLEGFGLRDEDDNIPAGTAYPFVASTYYVDLAGTYSYKSFNATVGMDNAFDKAPPFNFDGGQNANVNSYDFIGRFFYTRLSYLF